MNTFVVYEVSCFYTQYNKPEKVMCTKYHILKLVKGSLQIHLLCKQKLILADPRVKINKKAADECSFSAPQECN